MEALKADQLAEAEGLAAIDCILLAEADNQEAWAEAAEAEAEADRDTETAEAEAEAEAMR